MSTQNGTAQKMTYAPSIKFLKALQDWIHNEIVAELNRMEGMEHLVEMMKGISIIHYYIELKKEQNELKDDELELIILETVIQAMNELAEKNLIPS